MMRLNASPSMRASFQFVFAIAAGVLAGSFCGGAYALPIEDFATLSRRTYRVYGDVEESYRSNSSIGSLLTIEVPYNPRGDRLQFGGPGGEGFTATSTPTAPLFLRLSWDGESAVRVTSGAGLGCIDITKERANAFLIRDFFFTQSCIENGYECPFIEVQLKVFDGSDPTGQRYSAGVVRRRVINQKKDLMIPFSQLVREGPEGPWKPSCVGAVTLTVLSVPQVPTTIFMRSLTTNGTCVSPLESGRPTCPEVGGARPKSQAFPTIQDEEAAIPLEAIPAPPEVNVDASAPGIEVTPAPAASVPASRTVSVPEMRRTPKPVTDIDSMFDDLGEDVLESGRNDEAESDEDDLYPDIRKSSSGKSGSQERVFGNVASTRE